TDVANYARLLWAMGGEARCPKDGGRIERRSLDDCLDQVLALPEGSRILVIAPLMKARRAVVRNELSHLQVRGFNRVRISGEVFNIEDMTELPEDREELQLDVVVDRLVVRPD